VQLNLYAAGAKTPRNSPASECAVMLSHVHQVASAVETIDQAEHPPHDRTPLLITNVGKLARSGFRNFSPSCKIDFIAAVDRFASMLAVKSAHGFASGRSRQAEGEGTYQRSCVGIIDPLGKEAGEPIRGKIVAGRYGCLRRWATKGSDGRSRPSRSLSRNEQRRHSVLRKGESKQARAKQRETSRGQCQEAVGDKVMIAHGWTLRIEARSNSLKLSERAFS